MLKRQKGPSSSTLKALTASMGGKQSEGPLSSDISRLLLAESDHDDDDDDESIEESTGALDDDESSASEVEE